MHYSLMSAVQRTTGSVGLVEHRRPILAAGRRFGGRAPGHEFVALAVVLSTPGAASDVGGFVRDCGADAQWRA